ncbi:MAG: DNA repair protein RecN [Rhizobiaceae bacterium]
MLAHLSIRDIVLIRRLDITFGAGLSVLTGETGAGKSILLDALSLALGARGDASLVRNGADEGQVIAAFDIPPRHPVADALNKEAFEAGDGQLVLRRVQSPDGRTRVFINDQPASVNLMRRIGRALVEIHGQHDERALIEPDTHRDLLDSWAGHAGLARDVADAWQAWRDALEAFAEQEAKVEAAAREADFLRASMDELIALEPAPGEETLLAEERATMMRAEKIALEIHEAEQLLSSDGSPIAELSALLRRLTRKAPDAPEFVDPIIAPLDQALSNLDTVQSEIDSVIRAMEYDPQRLEDTEARLFALRAAARKHNTAVDDLAELRDRFAADLADLDAGGEKLKELRAKVDQAKADYDRLAGSLSLKRHDAAVPLATAVAAELPALKLEKAEFAVDVSSDAESGGPSGIDHIEFVVRTNPGSRAGPLMKVASGGELSRFLLALKVVLAERGSAPTLVFDEIDTGVGGAVADAIGERLARLAQRVQVLSVTHAPQVAAKADTHFLISKESEDETSTVTGVEEISDAGRQEEIARMLAGAAITDEARAAAGRLLTETWSKAS